MNERIATEVDQFSYLSESLKKEKNNHIKKQFSQLYDGTLPEFAQPIEEMRKEKILRLQRAKLFRDYRFENCKLRFEAEMEINDQDFTVSFGRFSLEFIMNFNFFSHFQNEKRMQIERLYEKFDQQRKDLEEERKKADSEYYSDLYKLRKTRQDKISKERRKKPVTVTGASIIYQLRDEEIDEDLNFITSIRMNSLS